MKDNTKISFIIPAKDEQNSVETLYGEIHKVVRKLKKSYEIIFIDDGSTDKTYNNLKNIYKKNSHVKVVLLRGNFGKSIALKTGFDLSVGDIVFTLDADLQDNPNEIPRFLSKLEKGFDLVSGWKRKRHDPITKVLPSRIFNFVASKLTGVNIHDINCGFKAYRREVVDSINLYGELYRFIPILAAKQNFKVGEITISHRPRRFGSTKFGWDRNITGLLDLITVVFLTGYLRRPGHFFGAIGLTSFSFGFFIGAILSYLRFTTGSIQGHYPLLFLGILLMIIGIQLITTGLLAEMIVSFNKQADTGDRYIKKVLD
jgi:glycosyltransferase involved in cell wall biosynthesis